MQNAKNRLPRDILKWLQNLDLSFAIKNVPRDFCNGFLIAEVLTRFFHNEISIHSFYNSASTNKKKLNWMVLSKFFLKNDFIPGVDQKLIDDVRNCETGSAIRLLKLLYTTITEKTIPEIPEPVQDEELTPLPSYTRPTASFKLKEALTRTDSIGEEEVSKTQEILQQHAEVLKTERKDAPLQLFSQTRAAPKARVTNRKVDNNKEAKIQPVNFVKTVQIKPLNENITQLRASRTISTGAPPNIAPVLPESIPVMTVMEILNNVLVSELEGLSVDGLAISQSFNPDLPPIVAFCNTLHSYNDSAASSIIRSISNSSVSAICSNCFSDPKEFFILFSVFIPPLHILSPSSGCFQAIIFLLSQIATDMITRDTVMPLFLLSQYGIFKITPIILQQPEKRHALIDLMLKFVVNDTGERVKLITSIRSIVTPDQLLMILAGLAPRENFNDELLCRLYFDASVKGLQSPEVVTQAATLSILTSLVNSSLHSQILELVHSFQNALIATGNWEIHTQLVLLAANSLALTDGSSQIAYDLLMTLLNETSPLAVLQLGLAAIIPHLLAHSQLIPLFVNLMLGSSELRDELLVDSDQPVIHLNLQSSFGFDYAFVPIHHHWDLLPILTAVLNSDQDPKARLDMLASCLTLDRRHLTSEWAQFFSRLITSELFMTGLETPALTAWTFACYLRFLFDSLTQEPALQLLLPSGNKPPFLFDTIIFLASNQASQTLISDFFRKSIATPFLGHTFNILKNFSDYDPASFQESNLGGLLTEMEQFVMN